MSEHLVYCIWWIHVRSLMVGQQAVSSNAYKTSKNYFNKHLELDSFTTQIKGLIKRFPQDLDECGFRCSTVDSIFIVEKQTNKQKNPENERYVDKITDLL